MPDKNTWSDALRLHESAAGEYASAAEALSPEMWATARGEGKWSPAQVTDHLILAYQALQRELSGGPGMALRTTAWQRVLLRLLLVPRLLRGAAFPRGARAPREIRPSEVTQDQRALIARFRDHAERFQAAIQDAHARNPGQRLTHPYFGASSLHDSLVLCARHILHHLRQLPEPLSTRPDAG
jgi:hypothetical protein